MTRGFDPASLRRSIARRFDEIGEIGGIDDRALDDLVAHALAVASDERLHLTSIREPDAFVDRHVVESLAALPTLDALESGRLLDLGSGNGYPGLALASARRDWRATLAEASPRRAAFLSETIAGLSIDADVHDRQVQRATDLDATFDVVTTRAMGGWEKILPRLAAAVRPGGRLLLWAGDEVGRVRTRAAWRRWEPAGDTRLPGRDRARLWEFRRP